MTNIRPDDGDERALSDEAIRQEDSIRTTVESLLDTDAFVEAGERPAGEATQQAGPSEGLSPAARGMAVGSVINDVLAEDDADTGTVGEGRESRARTRWTTVLRLLLALVAIGGAILIAAMLVINGRSASTPTSGGAVAPEAGSTNVSAVGDGAAPVTDCTVQPGTVTAVTSVTDTATDNHRTVTRGQTTITNTGATPVYVVWRESHSNGHDNSGQALLDEGWYGGPFIMQPGEVRTEQVGTQVFTSGEQTWSLITDLAVFSSSPECSTPVFNAGDQAFADLSEPVANPFPAGPAL